MKKSGLLLSLLILLLNSLTYAANGDLGTTNGANGTESAPFLIEDFADFQAFCADTSKWAAGVHTRLESDLDLDPDLPGRQIYTQAPIAGNTIGSEVFSGTKYSGFFKGNNHKIFNLTINADGFSGLFGYTDQAACICDIRIEKANILDQSWYSGALVGWDEGYIYNCSSNKGIVDGLKFSGGLIGYKNGGELFFSNTSNTSISARKGTIGGIIGCIQNGYVKHCFSINNDIGSILYSDSAPCQCGGFIGVNYYAKISFCYSTGNIIGGGEDLLGSVGHYFGGFIGTNNGIINNSYSKGHVTAYGKTTASGVRAGGFVGDNSGIIYNSYSLCSVNSEGNINGGFASSSSGYIKNCFSTGAVSGTTQTHGFIGATYADHLSNCFFDTSSSGHLDSGSIGAIGKNTAELTVASTYISVGWDFTNEINNGTHDIWYIPGDNEYPTFYNNHSRLSGNGTAEAPYLINNVQNIGMIMHHEPSAYYVLTSDIDLSNIKWTSSIIPEFYGNFNGNGHIISNLEIDDSYYSGFFGAIGNNGTITNLGITNSTIIGYGSYSGGLAGYSCGEINKCLYSGKVSSTHQCVGALLGGNWGTVNNCFTIGDVSGQGYIGGLVGNNANIISNSYSSCSVNGDNIGGISGYGNNQVNSFWNIDLCRNIQNDGAGLSNVEMQDINTFLDASWDFNAETENGTEDIWHMPYNATGYPMLYWQRDIPGDLTGSYGINLSDFSELSNDWLDRYDLADLQTLTANWLSGN